MQIELKRKILDLYPEFDRITGPSIAKDNRARVGLRNTKTGEKTVRQLAKVKLEVRIGRRLVEDETVDHVDEDKTNDDSDNLQLLSHSENARKSSIGNKRSLGYKQTNEQKRSGSKNGMALLDENKVKEMRENFVSGNVTKPELIANTNLNRRTIENILRGVSYTDAGGPIVDKFPRGRPKTNKSDDGEIG